MTSAPRALHATDPLELLDRAVGYTRGSLALVRDEDLGRPTPCAGWSLRFLLLHMDDALAAMAEAAHAPVLGLAPTSGSGQGAELLESIRQRACSLLGHWAALAPLVPAQPSLVALGEASLARETLAAVGALEITLHGWDVAQACGRTRPIPQGLALDLWPVAREHILEADRPHRFAAAVDLPDLASPATRLLAHAGRRG
jgi:uncharacterized protein (TIGR03086 family)